MNNVREGSNDMQSGKLSLQDLFLNQARKEKMPVTVFLMNGFQIKGYVRGFDSFTVILDTDGRQQMIYKHALSTIVPQRPINFMDADEGDNL